MRVFAGHSAADRGRVYADFFRNFFDHHRLQLIDAVLQEILPAGNDGETNLGDGLFPLLDVFDELNGAFITLFYLIASVFVVGIARQSIACMPGSSGD